VHNCRSRAPSAITRVSAILCSDPHLRRRAGPDIRRYLDTDSLTRTVEIEDHCPRAFLGDRVGALELFECRPRPAYTVASCRRSP
jgi:hypothetical protein